MIQEVMLAETLSPEEAKFPYLATPKIDGIRFYVYSSHIWTRSNKGISNLNIQRQVGPLLPDGIDGEIYDTSFGATQSLCGSHASEIQPTATLYLFDYFTDDKIGYGDRVTGLNEVVKQLRGQGWTKSPTASRPGLPLYRHHGYSFGICPLYPVWIQNFAQLERYYEDCLAAGHEGIILRCPVAPYKFGRSTIAENGMLRYKPTIDREAVILGVVEQLSNINPVVKNELGRSSRSTHQAGLVPAGTLGSFQVRDTLTDVVFNVGNGPGLTHIERMRLWNKRFELPGQVIEYRSMPYGVKEKPRHPQFLGIKSERIM